jgi:hypothetical protein
MSPRKRGRHHPAPNVSAPATALDPANVADPADGPGAQPGATGEAWRERLAEQQRAAAARRARRRADRAALAAARRHGLHARHTAKLGRGGGRR